MRIKINIALYFLLWGFAACTAHKKLINTPPAVNTEIKEKVKAAAENNIEQFAATYLLSDSNLLSAHVGISVYDAGAKKYLYNYQGNKYFIPASNTKLLTCYAAMKYLGDSLAGLRYEMKEDNQLYIQATGDPTFLHPDFENQPVFNFLKNAKQNINVVPPKWREKPLGFGWAWDDYNDDYMAERSEFPIYGNVAKFSAKNDTIEVMPNYFYSKNYGINVKDNEHFKNHPKEINNIAITRDVDKNFFQWKTVKSKFSSAEIPFKTNASPFPPSSFNEIKTLAYYVPYSILEDTLKKMFEYSLWIDRSYLLPNIIHSQPTDSLLKITMHRSDNFFAEQTLLMVSNERLGLMSDEKIIDTLLQTDYKLMPQKPKWVDGSGLSRYNLISPQDFIFLLEKMKNDFAWNRITTILPTGDEGTLKGLYKNYAGKIYAKTGTVSNNLALSGYIITNKNKQLIFSVMVNNHQASATAIRKSIERFITAIIENY
ncbi:MAG TPA: D-alanyl-D-alanine carboxypeptidase [Chitinophagaceae bacterium]|nr:D-alanyl-D-alanine carboxypeptidase [Chitinophagaceae bacterium]